MGFHENRTARCFIYAAGLHTYYTIFYDIYDTDAMFSAKSIQFGDDFGNFHRFAVQSLRNAGFKGESYVFSLIGSFFRCNAQHEKIIIIWLVGWIFQFQSFVADVPQITVTAVTVTHIERKVDSMLFAKFNFIFPGLHGPYIGHTPGSDNFQIGGEGFDGKFKTDLIVSFSRSAVADSGGIFLPGNFHQTFCDTGASHGSSQQIFVFVYGACLYTRHNIIVAKFIDDIFNVEFGSSGKFCSLVQSIQFCALSAVDAAADYFIIKGFLQPWNQRGSV